MKATRHFCRLSKIQDTVNLKKIQRSCKAKVANHFADKSYCASKGIWYYGVKLHILGINRLDALPEDIGVTPASGHGHDFNAFRKKKLIY
jgi:hypothetical protein